MALSFFLPGAFFLTAAGDSSAYFCSFFLQALFLSFISATGMKSIESRQCRGLHNHSLSAYTGISFRCSINFTNALLSIMPLPVYLFGTVCGSGSVSADRHRPSAITIFNQMAHRCFLMFALKNLSECIKLTNNAKQYRIALVISFFAETVSEIGRHSFPQNWSTFGSESNFWINLSTCSVSLIVERPKDKRRIPSQMPFGVITCKEMICAG